MVPISHAGAIVGEIDVDSDEPGAFGEADRRFLERVASLVSTDAYRAGASRTRS